MAELKRVIRQTMRRAARTWAPLPLPLWWSASASPRGKVDMYDHFPWPRAAGEAGLRRLVVVSLGLREFDRGLEPAEVAGALAAQIQAVVDERYRQGRTAAETGDRSG